MDKCEADALLSQSGIGRRLWGLGLRPSAKDPAFWTMPTRWGGASLMAVRVQIGVTSGYLWHDSSKRGWSPNHAVLRHLGLPDLGLLY